MPFTLSQSGSALFALAGTGVSLSLSGSDVLNIFSDEAEQTLGLRTRRDWVANPSTSLSESIAFTVNSMIAQKMVWNNMDGYRGTQAQTILDLLNDNINKNITELQKDNGQDVLDG